MFTIQMKIKSKQNDIILKPLISYRMYFFRSTAKVKKEHLYILINAHNNRLEKHQPNTWDERLLFHDSVNKKSPFLLNAEGL
jgi:hypothetical protein